MPAKAATVNTIKNVFCNFISPPHFVEPEFVMPNLVSNDIMVSGSRKVVAAVACSK
jgi:hypothetical protein